MIEVNEDVDGNASAGQGYVTEALIDDASLPPIEKSEKISGTSSHMIDRTNLITGTELMSI